MFLSIFVYHTYFQFRMLLFRFIIIIIKRILHTHFKCNKIHLRSMLTDSFVLIVEIKLLCIMKEENIYKI
jgi:hypothetical protein